MKVACTLNHSNKLYVHVHVYTIYHLSIHEFIYFLLLDQKEPTALTDAI